MSVAVAAAAAAASGISGCGIGGELVSGGLES